MNVRATTEMRAWRSDGSRANPRLKPQELQNFLRSRRRDPLQAKLFIITPGFSLRLAALMRTGRREAPDRSSRFMAPTVRNASCADVASPSPMDYLSFERVAQSHFGARGSEGAP